MSRTEFKICKVVGFPGGALFWVMTPCSLVCDSRFDEDPTSALQMEAVNLFEMFIPAVLYGGIAARSSVCTHFN